MNPDPEPELKFLLYGEHKLSITEWDMQELVQMDPYLEDAFGDAADALMFTEDEEPKWFVGPRPVFAQGLVKTDRVYVQWRARWRLMAKPAKIDSVDDLDVLADWALTLWDEAVRPGPDVPLSHYVGWYLDKYYTRLVLTPDPARYFTHIHAFTRDKHVPFPDTKPTSTKSNFEQVFCAVKQPVLTVLHRTLLVASKEVTLNVIKEGPFEYVEHGPNDLRLLGLAKDEAEYKRTEVRHGVYAWSQKWDETNNKLSSARTELLVDIAPFLGQDVFEAHANADADIVALDVLDRGGGRVERCVVVYYKTHVGTEEETAKVRVIYEFQCLCGFLGNRPIGLVRQPEGGALILAWVDLNNENDKDLHLGRTVLTNVVPRNGRVHARYDNSSLWLVWNSVAHYASINRSTGQVVVTPGISCHGASGAVVTDLVPFAERRAALRLKTQVVHPDGTIIHEDRIMILHAKHGQLYAKVVAQTQPWPSSVCAAPKSMSDKTALIWMHSKEEGIRVVQLDKHGNETQHMNEA